MENKNPGTFTNVKVWAAKARHGYPPADANIRNLVHGMLCMQKLLLLTPNVVHSFVFHNTLSKKCN